MTPEFNSLDDQINAARILAVDDHEANNLLLAQLLRRDGFRHVQITSDPREVATLLFDFNPDLILLDLHMPHMDGYEVLEVIRQFSAGQYLPVLVLTADTSNKALHRALAAGANDFLVKPLDALVVSQRTRNLLTTRIIYQELRRQNALLRAHVDVLEVTRPRDEESFELRKARISAVLEGDGPSVHFQPIVDLATRTIVGFEALARFEMDPQRTPDVWFSEAFDVGLGTKLEIKTVRKALEMLPQFDEGQFMSLNVSPETIMSNLTTQVDALVDWERVVIELTEHVSIEDYATVNAALQKLRTVGAGLSVDDTGSGFASLRHILNLAPDYVKLDVSLCLGIDKDPARQALASAMVTFATKTDCVIIAEGIETQDELDTLSALGVDLGQGFFLGRPGPLATKTES